MQWVQCYVLGPTNRICPDIGTPRLSATCASFRRSDPCSRSTTMPQGPWCLTPVRQASRLLLVPTAQSMLASRGRARWKFCLPCGDLKAQQFTCFARKDAGHTETEQAWEEWLQSNPLPGTTRAAAASGRSSCEASRDEDASRALPTKTQRFHWRNTHKVIGSLIEGGYDLSWESAGLRWRGARLLESSAAGDATACTEQHAEKDQCEVYVPRLLPPMAPNIGNPSAAYFLRHVSESSSNNHDGLVASGRQGVRCSRCLLVLLSANSAALGVWDERGRLLRHKVLTGYTVRAKQGKSQLYYTQQGGGAGSVGGRMRAREVKRLFGAVADRLDGWAEDIEECDRLFYSGDVRAWNEVFAAGPILGRDDERWARVGISVHKPRLKELQRVYSTLGYGQVHFTYTDIDRS